MVNQWHFIFILELLTLSLHKLWTFFLMIFGTKPSRICTAFKISFALRSISPLMCNVCMHRLILASPNWDVIRFDLSSSCSNKLMAVRRDLFLYDMISISAWRESTHCCFLARLSERDACNLDASSFRKRLSAFKRLNCLLLSELIVTSSNSANKFNESCEYAVNLRTINEYYINK